MARSELGEGARRPEGRVQRPLSVGVLVGSLLFHGVGAVGGGAAMLADPTGSNMGLDTAMLERTPFASFLWPGIVLGVVLGCGGLLVAYGVWTRRRVALLAPIERATGHHWSWVGSIGVGLGLVAWIVIQVVLAVGWSPLQPTMAAIGVTIVVLAAAPSTRIYLGDPDVSPQR